MENNYCTFTFTALSTLFSLAAAYNFEMEQIWKMQQVSYHQHVDKLQLGVINVGALK